MAHLISVLLRGGGLTALLDKIYPVGSIYMSTNNVSPQSFLGGQWAPIKDRFLLASGDNHSAGGTGGNETHSHALDSGYAKVLYSWDSSSGNHLCIRLKDTGADIPYLLKTRNDTTFNTGTFNNSFAAELGGNTDIDSNMPPFLVVYMWKRTS